MQGSNSIGFFNSLLMSIENSANTLPQTLASVDLSNLDYALGSALGLNETAGGLLLTLCMFMAFAILPIIKRNTTAILIIGILVMCFNVAMLWLTPIALVLVIFIVALGIADKFTGIAGGRLSGGNQ